MGSGRDRCDPEIQEAPAESGFQGVLYPRSPDNALTQTRALGSQYAPSVSAGASIATAQRGECRGAAGSPPFIQRDGESPDCPRFPQ